MRRRNFIRLAEGGVIAAASLSTIGRTSCGQTMPAEALFPKSILNTPDFPV
jgi:hypothetical protein